MREAHNRVAHPRRTSPGSVTTLVISSVSQSTSTITGIT